MSERGHSLPLVYVRMAVVSGIIVAFVLTACPEATAQMKAFPQAEGFAASASGGRGGAIYHVTSLADSNTFGTLRYGLTSYSPSTPVTIVFDVGGWIDLTSNLGVTRSNVTIAGQTAPGGIGVRNHKFSVGGDNIVVRHMRFRHGRYTNSPQDDSVNVNAEASDVIFDHVSADIGRDEDFSVQGRDVTLQWSSVSYGLETHSCGSLIEQAYRLSFHHNVYAHNHTRNPKARVNETIDWIDNVVYDYDIGFIAGDSDTTTYFWTANFDGNTFITGPADVGYDMIVDGRDWNYGLYFGTNAYDGDGDGTHDPAVYIGTGSASGLEDVVSGAYTWSATPYPVEDTIWKDATPEAAYQRVLAEFGPTPWNRDDFNALTASNIVNRTGDRISDQHTLPVGDGGWGTLVGGTASTDTDSDGMPDYWELKHGTPISTANNNGDFDSDGWTDLEEYLNDVAAFAATGPLEFDGTGRYADWANWTRRWEPSRLDEVHVDVGTATVDAVGQRAGTLRVAADTGSSGTLAVTAGWLEVTDDLIVGSGGTGTVNHTGGSVVVVGGSVIIDNGSYHLDGGQLSTPTLTKGAGGSFDFSGGTLHADEVAFDLVNNGGTIAPGNSIGSTHVSGDLELAAGAIQIELASASLVDTLQVDGQLTLGGDLDVVLLDAFAPETGSWQIIDAVSIAGSFESITEGFYVQRIGNSLFLVVGSMPVLAGDYNSDGVVDAADYTVWRDNLGAPAGTLPNDTDGGVIGQAQYDTWKANFGMTSSAALTASQNAVVPEPTSALLLLLTAIPLVLLAGGARTKRPYCCVQ